MNVEKNKCNAAAKELGYPGNMVIVTDTNAPSGCFVGHPVDNWKNTFYNQVDGKSESTDFKSICKEKIGIWSFIHETFSVY